MKMHRRDLLLIGGILVAAVICLCIFRFTARDGDVVVVYVDNVEYARLPIDKDTELVIQGVDSGTNRLIIKDNKAYICEASCPDKICVNTGTISVENEMIVCLPNRVAVVIERKS